MAWLRAAAAAAFLASCAPGTGSTIPTGTQEPGFCDDATSTGTEDELGNRLTTCEDVTNYNNFYEFSYNKEGISRLTNNFKTTPWTVTVSGLVNNPGTYSVDELVQKYMPVEYIYRMRCVEAWSVVVPWTGFPLNRLLQDVQPTSEAKYVRFLSYYNKDEMPGDASLPFPYFEGLRLDEALYTDTFFSLHNFVFLH